MKKRLGWLKKVFIDANDYHKTMTSPERYKRFRRTLTLVMIATFLIPLILTTMLSYYEHRSQMLADLRWNAESAKKTIETFLTELQTVLVYSLNGQTYEELVTGDNLKKLFNRLKSHYPSVVDLGIIDHNGIQQAYAGPYDLLGKNYSDREWFEVVTVNKTFIGQVEVGYRKVPHFTISVNFFNKNNGQTWIFRTSIDVSTLNRYIEQIGTGPLSDIFIVSRLGEPPLLQTSSEQYGPPLSPYPFELPHSRIGITISEERGVWDYVVLKAVSFIEGTPWALVLLKHGYLYGKDWSFFKARLFFIVMISTILALFIILQITKLFVGRIREADEKRESMMAEIEHTSKLASIGRLAAGIAHEINNPLAIISAKTGLIKDLLELSENFKYKNKIEAEIQGTANAVERCKVITHRLLGFARRMDITLESISINSLMKEVLSFLDQEALYRGIHIDLDLAESIPIIESDRGQLQQIFLNLINNAIDAIGKDGKVTIKTSKRDDDTVQVNVIDNGKGIPQDIISHIFDPFFTTKDTGEKKGTGLGLFITYGIIKK
ncbi:MAG: two-component sensor histidine kinase, partial [Deltaproteobacteria bacterium]|nr:two-component sensor histidine kinase [Deltaproteobacteria bacterium]